MSSAPLREPSPREDPGVEDAPPAGPRPPRSFVTAAVGLAALSLRLALLALHARPVHPDAAYALTVARSLAEGRGARDAFVLWNALEPSLAALPLPPERPANSYWLPLPEWLALPGVALGRALALAPELTHRLALVPFALCAVVCPLAALRLSRALSPAADPRRARLGAGLAVLFALLPGRAFFLLGAADTLGPAGALAWLALLALLANAPLARRHLAAACALGLACLARSELLLFSLLLLLFARRAGALPRERPLWLLGPALASGAFSLWLLLTFGRATPLTGAALWLRQYEELFAAAVRLDAAHLLAPRAGQSGAARLLELASERLVAGVSVPLLTLLQLAGPLALLALPGALALRGRAPPLLRAAGSAWLALTVALSLAAPHAASHGTALHDAGLLLPALAVLLAEGALALLPSAFWRAEGARARRLDAALLCALALCLGGLAWSASSTDRAEARGRPTDAALARWLTEHAALARGGVLTSRPAHLAYDVPLRALQLPSDGAAGLEALARRVDPGLWVLEPEHPPFAEEIYRGERRSFGAVRLELLAEPAPGVRVYGVMLAR